MLCCFGVVLLWLYFVLYALRLLLWGCVVWLWLWCGVVLYEHFFEHFFERFLRIFLNAFCEFFPHFYYIFMNILANILGILFLFCCHYKIVTNYLLLLMSGDVAFK